MVQEDIARFHRDVQMSGVLIAQLPELAGQCVNLPL